MTKQSRPVVSICAIHLNALHTVVGECNRHAIEAAKRQGAERGFTSQTVPPCFWHLFKITKPSPLFDEETLHKPRYIGVAFGPDCALMVPINVLSDEENMPEHAIFPTLQIPKESRIDSASGAHFSMCLLDMGQALPPGHIDVNLPLYKDQFTALEITRVDDAMKIIERIFDGETYAGPGSREIVGYELGTLYNPAIVAMMSAVMLGTDSSNGSEAMCRMESLPLEPYEQALVGARWPGSWNADARGVFLGRPDESFDDSDDYDCEEDSEDCDYE